VIGGNENMIGRPKYKWREVVSFKWRNTVVTGQIQIVDAYGTFEQGEEPSYDIMIMYEGSECLVKHVRESWIVSN
jgi:hypothetical protein